jgi:hypothetical protein
MSLRDYAFEVLVSASHSVVAMFPFDVQTLLESPRDMT